MINVARNALLHNELRPILEGVGFSFHHRAQDEDRPTGPLHHWWCWCGPAGAWDVEVGADQPSEADAILDAAAALATFTKEEAEADGIDEIAHATHAGVAGGFEEAQPVVVSALGAAHKALDRVLADVPYGDQWASEPFDEVRDALRLLGADPTDYAYTAETE